MKIKIEVEIFDDPEYCENESDGFAGSESCEHIDSSEAVYTCKIPSWYSGELEHDKNGRLKKCPQCKAAYLKSCEEENREIGQLYVRAAEEEAEEYEQSLFTDENGNPYIDPMHPERGTINR